MVSPAEIPRPRSYLTPLGMTGVPVTCCMGRCSLHGSQGVCREWLARSREQREIAASRDEHLQVEEIPELGAVKERAELVDQDLVWGIDLDRRATPHDRHDRLHVGHRLGDGVDHDRLTGRAGAQARERRGRTLDLDVEARCAQAPLDLALDAREFPLAVPEPVQISCRAMSRVHGR